MKRITSSVTKRFDGKRVYTSNRLAVIPVSDNDIYIIANEDTKLDFLAYKYYNDASLWWLIAKANNVGNGTYSVAAGTQLRIPFNTSIF